MSGLDGSKFCEACRFYELKFDQDAGWCNRYAPRPALHGFVPGKELDDRLPTGWNSAFWPVVQAEDWCGEWERRI